MKAHPCNYMHTCKHTHIHVMNDVFPTTFIPYAGSSARKPVQELRLILSTLKALCVSYRVLMGFIGLKDH